MNIMGYDQIPTKQGLYDPRFERDNCGVGFVCDIQGAPSHDIVEKGIKVLERMSHRGAVGADPKTGDGAGVLSQIPHRFYSKVCAALGITLPGPGEYGTGLIFMPRNKKDRFDCGNIIENIISEEGQIFLGWRKVPVDDSMLGESAVNTQPIIEQVFIGQGKNIADQLAFECKLYVIRKRAEREIRLSKIGEKNSFYITNISMRTISYKGLLMPGQIRDYYPDLKDSDFKSAIMLVHSRYSTNTFPAWDLAQPFRFLAHNGEINTLRGNINWFHAGERLLESELFGSDIAKIKPIIVEGGSDSATLDNVFELLVLAGRSLEHTMMMLVPSAKDRDGKNYTSLRDFYKYHACLMEPWDGPAAIAFTDGKDIGAALDRNGLRPVRYIVTKSGLIVMSSEAGVLDIDDKDISRSGRLEPGKMILIDTEKGSLFENYEIKERVAGLCPYGEWNRKNIVELDNLPRLGEEGRRVGEILPALQSFGYTREDLKLILKPMAEEGKEPIGSMGNDTPHAFLSREPQMFFNYFKQLFAQVTNPPIDPIREELVMSLDLFIGSGKNLLVGGLEHCHKLRVKRPILTNEELELIRDIKINGFKTKVIRTLFNPGDWHDLEEAVNRICFEAEYAIEQGHSFIILSDRGTDRVNAAIPALLAVSAVHHHLVDKAIRSQISIVVKSGEPREVNHFALLYAYGADCVNPYLAYEAVEYLHDEGEVSIDKKEAVDNYRQAVMQGILKILSKMGISTLRSYRGAQIFEALGLGEDLIKRYFTYTVSRVGGVELKEIAEDTINRHREAYPDNERAGPYVLPTGGIYQWKRDGEFHVWNPESIAALQDAVRKNDYAKYKEFASLINDRMTDPATLRDLLKFKEAKPIPIEEVEPVSEIVKRFATGAMSFGSISGSAHEAIAIAMNRLGAKSNTGEGGEDPARFRSLPNGASTRSAVKQVASGRFGVTTNYLINSEEIQIKIAQGAKPGEGGQLPGYKVSAAIARIRYTTPGVTLISPPPHHDIYSIEDLAQLIFDLKNVNPKARISVKLVSEVGVGTIAAGVAKAHADMILISGGDGGTGASPRSSIRYAGAPWELGLAETHQTLMLNGLRGRVRLQADGQMRTGKDVVIAALLGAEEFGFCTAVLITLGCVMLRHCNLNNCSVGVATQDELLQKRFSGRPEYVVNYMKFIAEDLREQMSLLGMRTIDEMVGRTDFLEMDNEKIPEKAKGTDYSGILYRPELPGNPPAHCVMTQDHCIDEVLDRKLIRMTEEAVRNNKKIELELDIKNYNRSTGAMLSGEVCKTLGENGLSEETIKCRFNGTAGQSFGAFLVGGITFELSGMANDYVGKGMSGGKLIIYPGKHTDYEAEKNVIAGNTCFYGATSGEAYIRGIAGERFCVRNSGVYVVVEGVGDHGCEYMTGGRVVVLGKTGDNFAAGMSGGIAYVYDEDGKFSDRCNMSMVEIEDPDKEDEEMIRSLIHNHHVNTDSRKAGKILKNFSQEIKKFKKIMPMEYKNVLAAKKRVGDAYPMEVLDG